MPISTRSMGQSTTLTEKYRVIIATEREELKKEEKKLATYEEQIKTLRKQIEARHATISKTEKLLNPPDKAPERPDKTSERFCNIALLEDFYRNPYPTTRIIINEKPKGILGDKPQGRHLLIAGASISSHLDPERLIPGNTVTNISKSGAGSQDILDQLLNYDGPAKDVYVQGPTNDLKRQNVDVKKNIRTIMDTASKRFDKCYFGSILPRPDCPYDRKAWEINCYIKQLCFEFGFHFIDHDPVFLTRDKRYIRWNLYQVRRNRIDIHPTTRGTSLMAMNIRNYLCKFGSYSVFH